MATCPRLRTPTEVQQEAAKQASSVGRMKRDLPQTGGVLSRVPGYLRSPQAEVGCQHGSCLRKQALWETLREDENIAHEEEKIYLAMFAADAARVVEQSGLHAHTASCYKYESGREKDGRPEHCRFGFMHFVALWCWRMILRRGKEVKTAVQRIFARFGKEPVLPRGYCMSESEKVEGVRPSVDMFAPYYPGLGSQVNPSDSSDRPGRINTVRLHPRETSTLVAGIVAHRGNLDYQDLRTTLDNLDGNHAQLPCEIKVHAPGALQELKSLLRHFSASLTSYQMKTARLLHRFLAPVDVRPLMQARRNFYWALEPRAGKAEIPRIGDRHRDKEWKSFSRFVTDSVVEAMRSAVQIGFYVCDYATKPNVTTGRVLQYMHRGMQRLEKELQEKEHAKRILEMEAAGVLDDPGRLPIGVAEQVQPVSEIEARQDKVRRILIRLWSAANYSYLKGSSLQLVHLLTRRECFRTHRYWQVLTKRLVWSGHRVWGRQETVV